MKITFTRKEVEEVMIRYANTLTGRNMDEVSTGYGHFSEMTISQKEQPEVEVSVEVE